MYQLSRMLLILCLALTGCSRLHNMPVMPYPDIPANWHEVSLGTQSVPFQWREFKDPALNVWIDRVLSSNYDLKQAAIRLEQAERTYEKNEDEYLPTLSASLSSSSSRASNSKIWLSGSGAQASLDIKPDLTGMLNGQTKAARFERDSVAYARESIRQSIMVTAASLYWGLALLNEKIRVSEHSLVTAEKLVSITHIRYKVGHIASLDVARAQQNRLEQQIRLQALRNEKLRRQRAQAILLGGGEVENLPDPQTLHIKNLPLVSAGIPACVLARRPDLQAAQIRIQEANSRIEVAHASFYPSLNLTASAGSSSAALIRFIAQPALALGAGLSLPFLQWREHTSELNEARSQFQQRSLDWQRALYQALVDIQNGLTERTYLLKQARQLQQAFIVALNAERISQVRYQAGTVTVNELTDAQMSRRQSELAISTNHYEQLNNLANLWRDLGGDAPLPVSSGQRKFSKRNGCGNNSYQSHNNEFLKGKMND